MAESAYHSQGQWDFPFLRRDTYGGLDKQKEFSITRTVRTWERKIVMTLTGENKQDIAMAVTYEGKEEIAMGGDMTKWFAHGMNPLYLTYLLNSPYCRACKQALATGNIIVHISNDKLGSIPLPVPPLAEQHRIVAKLEELLPFCDKLKK